MKDQVEPKYGHLIGPEKCQLEDCKGHKSKAGASIHHLYQKYYGQEKELTQKAKKVQAKAIGVKCFNAMTGAELDEALALSVNLNAGKLMDEDSAKNRIRAIEEVARQRMRERLKKIKRGKK